MSKIKEPENNTDIFKEEFKRLLFENQDIHYSEANNIIRNCDYLFKELSNSSHLRDVRLKVDDIPNDINFPISKPRVGYRIDITIAETKESDFFKHMLGVAKKNQLNYFDIKKVLRQIDKELLAISFKQAL